MRATEFIVEEMTSEENKCPPATQDITLNLKNRQKAIDEYGYGPLNPDMPNRKFWMKKVDEWNLDSIQEAQQSLCGNCAAFDIRQETLDCIAQGIDSGNPQDAQGVIDAGDLGYCKFLKFKCASRRTCDAWVTGGPLVDKQGMAEGIPQPGPSSGAPKQFGPDAKIQTQQMTAKQLIASVPGLPYYNNVVDDWDAKDYSWGVTKKVIEYATYLKDHPESLAKLPPILVLNGKFEDGAHRVSAIWLLQQRMDTKNPLWANAKLNVQFIKTGVAENFHDGRNPQDRGDSARHGIAKKSSLSSLDKIVRSKTASPRKKQLAHWQANMRRGRAKKH